MNRREFVQSVASVALTGLARKTLAGSAKLPPVSASRLPRWRGFNLLEKFAAEQNAPFRESDFAWVARWGFNFVRLPLSYRCWVDDPMQWKDLKEPVLMEIDQAVELGRRYGVHVNINLHRAPGYCVNPPKEPLVLWSDEQGLDACAFHWAHFARRYKGIPNTRLSFDLLNEPALVSEAVYLRVAARLVEAIRAEDPNRLIIADGLVWGRVPVASLVNLRIAQSTRGYDPIQVSHYKASWIGGSDKWPEPTWPLQIGGKEVWNKERLRTERIAPWKALEQKGVGVHVGEWGAYNQTPHAVVLAWMRDNLELWKEAGRGWALWNFRGSFGILDSERKDVNYENFRGHTLDRAMLELLRAY